MEYGCTYMHIYMHKYVCVIIFGFMIYLDHSYSFNNSITFFTNCHSFETLENLGMGSVWGTMLVGEGIISFILFTSTLCSFYARGQKYKAACEPRNLCTVGRDEAQNHRDRINRNVMR